MASHGWKGDGKYPGDGGSQLQTLWEAHQWKEIRRCPGRYVSSSHILREVEPETVLKMVDLKCFDLHCFDPPEKDTISIARFEDGGALLTYTKLTNVEAPVFVHTLNTESGLLRKIDALKLAQYFDASKEPHIPVILNIFTFLHDNEKNNSATHLVRILMLRSKS